MNLAQHSDIPPIFDRKWYRHVSGVLVKEWDDYVQRGDAIGLSPHPLFCPLWYARQERENRARDTVCLLDYFKAGSYNGLDPVPVFDTDWYRETYMTKDDGINPLIHYISQGAARGYRPCEEFVPEVFEPYLSNSTEAPQRLVERWLRKFYWNGLWASDKKKNAARHNRSNTKWLNKIKRCMGLQSHETPQISKRSVGKAGSSLGVQGDKLRVVFISGAPASASHTYRVSRALKTLEARGHDVQWVAAENMLSKLVDLLFADIVVVFRAELTPVLRLVLAMVKRGGGACIFDVDDLIVRPELASITHVDVIRYWGGREDLFAAEFQRMRATLEMCDYATAPTAVLAGELGRIMNKPCHIIPNGYDEDTLKVAEAARRSRVQKDKPDDWLRIGYATGSNTHQKDFAEASRALAHILTEFPGSRLVLFCDRPDLPVLLDLNEFPEMSAVADQIEWRRYVLLSELPNELARFDINIAPLQSGNPYVEAKSELKFFEAALVDVPTVASPTAPYKEAIRDGETGFLAANEQEWHEKLKRLIEDAELRKDMAARARQEALWKYGPERRGELLEIAYREMLTLHHANRAPAMSGHLGAVIED